MGTRGMKIVRFRGRYFVYYNKFDSYPEVLGKMLVEQIPTDPERYKRWLEHQRNIYVQMTTDLESKVLTVTDETLRTYGSEDEEFTTWQMLDDRLWNLPSAVCGMGRDLFIEWTYTIDLDREIFSVDQWIHFSLKEIPQGRWIEGFQVDDEGRRSFSFEICSECTDEYPTIEYFANDKSRDEYTAKYQQYHCSTVKATSEIEITSKTAHGQIIAVIMLERFMSPEKLHFQEYLPGWSHNDFAFRELAFAILSFAAGQFRFDEPKWLGGESSNGYLIDPDDEALGGKPKLLPLFAAGCHSPGKEAGSAPQASMYWFGNVLVSLVPDFVIQNSPEAAIAKVVEFGLGEGKVDFHAVVFSLIRVIMLQVFVEKGVTVIKRSEAAELSTPAEDVSADADPLETYCRRRAGFISLIHFFNMEANRHLSPFSQGCFPTEIYMRILANTEGSTYSSCANVSRVFRAFSQENILFGKDLMLIKFSAERDAKLPEWKFTFLDRNTGGIMECGLGRRGTKASWSPIIGVERPSIITQIGLLFETRSVPTQKPRRRRPSLSHGFPTYTSEFRNISWEIPRNAIVSQVEEVWGFYLKKVFERHRNDPMSSWIITADTYLCTTIPHYRELSVSYLYKRTLWVCLRRPVDGDTPQKRAETLAYVTARLSGRAKKEEPVMVAFGMDVGLYDWIEKDDGGERQLELRVHYEDYSLEASRVEFETQTLAPLKRDWEAGSQ